MPSAPGLLLLAAALAQAASDAPSFPSEASAITVDVVVLDDDGQPVRGLTRDDFTVREWVAKTPQVVIPKSFDTHGPFGPWIVTADEVGDPHGLTINIRIPYEAADS